MKLLCLGDSLTYGYDVRPQERWTTLVSNRSTIEIDNKGQCGDTTAGMVFRLHQLDLIGYDAFFVMGGSNDILLDKDFSAVCRNFAVKIPGGARLYRHSTTDQIGKRLLWLAGSRCRTSS